MQIYALLQMSLWQNGSCCSLSWLFSREHEYRTDPYKGLWGFFLIQGSFGHSLVFSLLLSCVMEIFLCCYLSMLSSTVVQGNITSQSRLKADLRHTLILLPCGHVVHGALDSSKLAVCLNGFKRETVEAAVFATNFTKYQ